MNPAFLIHLPVWWPRIPLVCWCLMFKPHQRGLELTLSLCHAVARPAAQCFAHETSQPVLGPLGDTPGLIPVCTAREVLVTLPRVWACLCLFLVHMPNAGSKSLLLQSQGTLEMLAQLREDKIFPATALWEGRQLPCTAAGSEVC